MSLITVEKLSGTEVFTLLCDDWQRLFAAGNCVPFLSREWLAAWYKHFGADRSLFILKVTRANRLIGILPLCLQEKKILGVKIKRLAFLGEAQGGADYLDLIAEKENKPAILAAIFQFLKAERGFDVISFENLENNSEIVGFLKNLNEKELRCKNMQTSVCPQINLSDGWETVLKQSKRADNFKRRLKKLEKIQGFGFRSITSPAEIEAAFERFYYLHEKRWAKDGGSELSGHPRLLTFQREVVKNLANANLIRFDELWAEGKCRASVYGLDDGKCFYYYNSGYDLDWANKSVGLVLIGLSVKSAIERGNLLYDFLRGDENYKFDWANQKNELITANLSRKTAPAMVYNTVNHTAFQLRNFSKDALPKEFAEKLKTLKRIWQRNRQLDVTPSI